MAKKSRLGGIVVATILPFKDDLTIDEEAFAEHLRRLLRAGVSGLFCNGHVGEVSKLSREERKRAVEMTVEEAKGASVPVIAGIESEYTEEAIQFTKDAEEAGADIALILPPYHMYGALTSGRLDPRGDIAYRHHKRIADATSIPLMLFKYPSRASVAYTREALKRLCEIQSLAAVKMANFDLHDFQEDYNLVRMIRPDISIMTADDILLTYAFAIGADGASAGICNIATSLWVRIYDCVKTGNLEQAIRLQNQLYPIMKVTHDPLTQHVVRIKLTLHELGLLRNPTVRGPPYLGDEDLAAVREALSNAPVVRSEEIEA